MIILYCITGMALSGSFLVNRRKTKAAVITAARRFGHIIPAIFIMLTLISCIPVHVMIGGLFKIIDHANGIVGIGVAAMTGSVMMLPGFIVFPLCGVFAREGVPYFILSALTTTMMLVGVVTFPLEKKYLGTKLALVRNLLGFIIALAVAGITGIVFGEF